MKSSLLNNGMIILRIHEKSGAEKIKNNLKGLAEENPECEKENKVLDYLRALVHIIEI